MPWIHSHLKRAYVLRCTAAGHRDRPGCAFLPGYTGSMRSIATVACPQPAQAASRRASARARAASRPCPPNRRRTRATRSCTAQHSKVKQSNATIRNAKKRKAVQCSAVQCSAVQCSAVQRSAAQCSAVRRPMGRELSAVLCQLRPHLLCVVLAAHAAQLRPWPRHRWVPLR
jgi:hypothetical protein